MMFSKEKEDSGLCANVECGNRHYNKARIRVHGTFWSLCDPCKMRVIEAPTYQDLTSLLERLLDRGVYRLVVTAREEYVQCIVCGGDGTSKEDTWHKKRCLVTQALSALEKVV